MSLYRLYLHMSAKRVDLCRVPDTSLFGNTVLNSVFHVFGGICLLLVADFPKQRYIHHGTGMFRFL